MTSRDFDPIRLDVAAFANVAAEVEGCWPLAGFDRLLSSTVSDASKPGAGDVTWSARGERRVLRAGNAQIWLHLAASAVLPLECQRCLKAVEVPLQIDRNFLFVHGEEAAAKLDEETDDDVLAIPQSLNVHELVEDELLLALPLVPKHDVCPQPLPVRIDELDEAESPNPFAALAALRRPGPLN